MSSPIWQIARLLILLTVPFVCIPELIAQEVKPSPSILSPDEQQLINSRRANEEAQAEYYREQTKRLREPPPPAPIKSFWQNVADNPASILGVSGAIVAALFAACVGLLTLYINNRASLRVQRDTQFYEAMKRFGDKDSPVLRSSAAGILAQMASTETREFDVLHPITSLKKKKRPYLITARNQLVAGLLFEEHRTAVLYLRGPIIQMVNLDPFGTATMLYNTNRALQEYLRDSLVKFFIAIGIENPNDITEDMWNELPYTPVYDVDVFKALANQSPERFAGMFKRSLIEFRTLDTEEKQKAVLNSTKDFSRAAYNMYLNVNILSYALKTHQLSGVINKNPPFLVNGDLKEINLGFSNLQNSLLNGAQLQGACLILAKLQGTNLRNADLSESLLYGCKVDETTDMHYTNWWKANFYFDGKQKPDLELLDFFYRHYSSSIPDNIDELHPSVREFLLKVKAEELNATNKTEAKSH